MWTPPPQIRTVLTAVLCWIRPAKDNFISQQAHVFMRYLLENNIWCKFDRLTVTTPDSGRRLAYLTWGLFAELVVLKGLLCDSVPHNSGIKDHFGPAATFHCTIIPPEGFSITAAFKSVFVDPAQAFVINFNGMEHPCSPGQVTLCNNSALFKCLVL